MLQPADLISSPPPDPFQKFPTEEARRDWFRRNALYILSFFDRKTYFQGEDAETMLYPSETIEKYFRYYLGRQELPMAYRQTAVDQDNKPLRTVWINDQKLGTLIDRLTDTGKTVINNMKVTAFATSREAQNERTRILESLRTKVMLREDFDEFEKLAGVSYQPVGKKDQEFYNVEEAERWMNLDYREESARWGQDIAEDIWNRNHLKTESATALLHTHITGITGMHTYVYNGQVITERVSPGELIWDPNCLDDPFHYKDQLVGRVDFINPSAVMAMYGDQLSDQEKEEIRNHTSNTIADTIGWYGRVPGYTTGAYGIKYSRARVYWVGKRNLGWKEAKEDQWGHKAFYSTKGEEEGDYNDQCVFQATLIGNKYLVDIGVMPNQVKKPYNPGESELPIKVFTPNIALGIPNGSVSRIHQIADLISYYSNEIKKTVAKSLGKGLVFYADAFEGPVIPAKFYSDIEQYGITVANRKKGEPGLQDQQKQLTHEMVDFTIDINVVKLAELRSEQERIMESILSVTPIMTGSQGQYVSEGTQKQSIQQSNISALSVMNDFVTFMEIVMQHATNVGRIIHSMEDGNSIPIAGDRGSKWLQETSKFSLEQLGISIRVLDIIDEKGKLRLQEIALGLVNSKMFSMLDWVMVEKAQTYSEALDYFSMIAKRQQRDQQAAQQFAMAQQKVEAERQSQAVRDSVAGKLQETQMVVDGKSKDTQLKVQADLVKAGLQAGVAAQPQTV